MATLLLKIAVITLVISTGSWVGSLLLPNGGADCECPVPWKRVAHMCLFFGREHGMKSKMRWIDAETRCNDNGGFLLWIRNKTEHDIILKHFRNVYFVYDNFYIGLYKHDTENYLVWKSQKSQSWCQDSRLFDHKHQNHLALTRPIVTHIAGSNFQTRTHRKDSKDIESKFINKIAKIAKT